MSCREAEYCEPAALRAILFDILRYRQVSFNQHFRQTTAADVSLQDLCCASAYQLRQY